MSDQTASQTLADSLEMSAQRPSGGPSATTQPAGLVVVLAGDHASVDLKDAIGARLKQAGITARDLGTNSQDSVDYPDFADKVADALTSGQATRGILICGTGIGIAMAANRHRGVRAAVCHDATTARLARAHNDANVLALGARVIGPEVAFDCVAAFLATPFEGSARHQRRVAMLDRPRNN